MDIDALRGRLNQSVRLIFTDGEIVDAILLGIDSERDRDLTYEVTRVVRPGVPRARGTRPGATCVAKLNELEAWTPT